MDIRDPVMVAVVRLLGLEEPVREWELRGAGRIVMDCTAGRGDMPNGWARALSK